MTCLHPDLPGRSGYRMGCRCDRCRAGMRAASRARAAFKCGGCGREVKRQQPGDRLCHVCHEVATTTAPEPNETVRRWAKRVWARWTPRERAEFAGALDSLFDSLNGGGHGVPVAATAERSDVAPRMSVADRLDESVRAGGYGWSQGGRWIGKEGKKRRTRRAA